jgi:hypothetical protein
MLMFSNIMRIFTSPYVTTVPADFSMHTHETLLHQKKSVEVGLDLFNAGKEITMTTQKNWESYHTK